MEIMESDYFTFEEYKNSRKIHMELDPKEINFQNRVILQLLDSVFFQ